MEAEKRKQFEGELLQEEKEKNKVISMLKYKLEELEKSPTEEVEGKVDSLILSLLKEGKSFETNCQEESVDRLLNYIDDFDSSYMEESRSLYDISYELTESENNSGSWLYDSQKAKLELFRFELEDSDFFQEVKRDLEGNGFNISEQGENTHLLFMLNGLEKTLLDKANELGMDPDEIKIEDLKEMVNEFSGEKKYALEKDLEAWRQEALETLREEGDVFVLVGAKDVEFKSLEELESETLLNDVSIKVQAISSKKEELEEMVEPNVKGLNGHGGKLFSANVGMIASPTLEQLKDPAYDPGVETESGILKLEDIKKEVSYKLEHGTEKKPPKEKESKIPKKEKKKEGNER